MYRNRRQGKDKLLPVVSFLSPELNSLLKETNRNNSRTEFSVQGNQQKQFKLVPVLYFQQFFHTLRFQFNLVSAFVR